jgi:hypothetical protein
VAGEAAVPRYESVIGPDHDRLQQAEIGHAAGGRLYVAHVPAVAVAYAIRADRHRSAATLRFGLSGVSFRADRPAELVFASGSSRAAIALGARGSSRRHSRRAPRARLLPTTIVAARDADAARAERRHDRATGCAENPSAGAFADLVQGAPLGEGQNFVVIRHTLVRALPAISLSEEHF